jgi:hypothetical protein
VGLSLGEGERLSEGEGVASAVGEVVGEGEADVSTFSSCVEVSETVEEIATKKIPTRIAILCQALSWINRDHIFFNT